MSARLVITGAGGLVGQVLTAEAQRRGHRVLALTSAQCDVTDAAAPEHYIAAGDAVINCAAYTKVDQAEADEAGARAVNATGAQNVARACARAGAALVHISTDYVFSGTFSGEVPRPYDVDDETGPLSVYGRTKLEGELAVLSAMPDAHVVRTSWIYEGGDGGDFVATMRRLAAGDDQVDVVADQVGSPTYVGDLVGALLEVAEGGIRAPVLHAANQGVGSRFEQAQAVFELVGADPDRVRPVGSNLHPRPAPRPAYSPLAAQRSTAAGLTPLRPWRDALAAALSARPQSDGPLTSTP
jgi:dTDP-4-dehydrorhamnose reductase